VSCQLRVFSDLPDSFTNSKGQAGELGNIRFSDRVKLNTKKSNLNRSILLYEAIDRAKQKYFWQFRVAL
jgi:hypothetical protein